MIRFLLLGSTLIAMSPGSVSAQSVLDYPRLANMYLQGSVNQDDIPTLAQWDLLILSTVWTQQDLQQLRDLNPDIKIFLYVCGYCVETQPPAIDTWMLGNLAYAESNDLWWYDRNANIASDWPGAQIVNLTEQGYAGPQGSWRQFMAQQIEMLVASRPAVDGVFLDNYWKRLSWNQDTLQLDSDCNPTHNPTGCDGVMDSPADLDSLWNRALRFMVADLRGRFDTLEKQRSRPLAIHSNGASDYFSWLNGTLHEFFPSGWSNVDPGNPYGYNWNFEMLSNPGGYLVAPFRADPMMVPVLNADWTGSRVAPDRSAGFERHKRFTFVSSLLGDGYYSLDAGDQIGHGSLWWEPEYDNDGRGSGYLGQPLGDMQRVAVPTGPQKISNGDFSNNLTGWSYYPFDVSGSITWDTSVYHSQPAAAHITVFTLDAPTANYKLWQSPIALVADAGYTLSFWARAVPAQDMLLHLYSDDCPSSRCLRDKTFALTAEWQEFIVSFQSTATTNAVGLNLFVTSLGQVWIDDVSLREGDSSVYRRDFENGVVLLNYTADAIQLDLGKNYQRLDIAGSPVFDGAILQQEIVPPWDARVLLNVAPGNGPPSGGTPPPIQNGRLDQNVPNPFNPGTQIYFEVAVQEKVLLEVYDVGGHLVRTLVRRVMPEGVEHTVTWNGRNQYDREVASGIYFYRLQTPTITRIRKMTLLR